MSSIIIDFELEKASEKSCAELEKEIEGFLKDQYAFKKNQTIIDHKTGNKIYRLEGLNEEQ